MILLFERQGGLGTISVDVSNVMAFRENSICLFCCAAVNVTLRNGANREYGFSSVEDAKRFAEALRVAMKEHADAANAVVMGAPVAEETTPLKNDE